MTTAELPPLTDADIESAVLMLSGLHLAWHRSDSRTADARELARVVALMAGEIRAMRAEAVARERHLVEWEQAAEGFAERLRLAEQERDALTAAMKVATERMAAAEREADRWRHGVPVEGDYVCPDSLRAEKAEAALAGKVDEAFIQGWAVRLARTEAVVHNTSATVAHVRVWREELDALLADLSARPVSPPKAERLNVADALRDPRVRDGSMWIEYSLDEVRRQMMVDQPSSLRLVLHRRLPAGPGEWFGLPLGLRDLDAEATLVEPGHGGVP